MAELKLTKREMQIDNVEVRLVYDEDADILEIFFGGNQPATGIQLTDQILLRIDRATGRALSLTLLDFSVLTEWTLFGQRSFPISGLDQVPPDLREAVLRSVQSTPVNHFLALTYFQARSSGQIPAVHVHADELKQAA